MIADDVIMLRAPEPDDLDSMFRWENEPNKSDTSSAVAPLSRKQLWDYIENYDGDIYSARQLRMIIVRRSDGLRLGTVDISDFEPRDRRGFVGIYIEARERRHGYALRALELLCRHASAVIGLHQLAAVVVDGNQASRGLFVKAGFRPCGKLRSWVRRGRLYADVIVFQRLFEV